MGGRAITVGVFTGIKIAQAFARARDAHELRLGKHAYRTGRCRDCMDHWALTFTGTAYCPPLCESCFRKLHGGAP
jgi:hypothetical protein